MSEELETYPQFIMQKLRGRLGLEDNDTSRDHLIMEWSKDRVMEEIFGWELGDPRWWDTVKDWMGQVGLKSSPEGDLVQWTKNIDDDEVYYLRMTSDQRDEAEWYLSQDDSGDKCEEFLEKMPKMPVAAFACTDPGDGGLCWDDGVTDE